MKILVIGCGSIGRRHIRLLKEMGVAVFGVDVDQERSDAVCREFGIPVFGRMNGESVDWSQHQIPEGFDGAIIATPNHLHREPAMECIRAGLPVLVEKPIAHTLEDARAIAEATRAYGEDWRSSVLVGYSLRFHPGLRRVKELLDQGAIGQVRHASIHFGSYLPDWRPGFDYRQGYAASREQGGGILMDASHELDYACWLFGKPVSVMAQVQNTGALEIETEDVADLVVRFESGLQTSIHLDYLSRDYRRGCHIIGDTGSAEFAMEAGLYTVFHCPAKWAGEKAYRWQETLHADDLYRAELRHFLACIRGEETPLVTGADGVRAVQLVEAAKRSSAEGRMITL